MLPLSTKYAPKSTKEILGQERAVKALQDFIASFKTKKKRALLLYGPPGCGKTSAAYAIAKEFNLEILEVNASNFRDEKKLHDSIGQASAQQSLFKKSKILLVDEVDGLMNRFDRGAIPTIVQFVKTTAFPIIITANNPWDRKFSPLRTASEMVEFAQLSHQTVLTALRSICAAENIVYEEKALASLARRAGGDLRGALIDLQTLTSSNKLTMADLDVLSDRHRTDTIFNALLKVFKTTDVFVARMAFENVEEDLEEIQLWMDENLPKEYTKPKDLFRAYEKISHTDVFRGRIMKRQHWHFLATMSVLLSAGIALSKDEKYNSFTRYTPTQRLLTIWRLNQRYAKRAAIAEKIAQKTHSSKKATIRNTLPYIQAMVKRSKKHAADFSSYFDFNQEEVAWLLGKQKI